MTLSKAKLEADARHHAKLDHIKIQPYKDEGKRIREAAARAGESVQMYILTAVRRRMEEEQAT